MTATTEEKLKALNEMFGEEQAARILSMADSQESQAKEAGIEAKEAKEDPQPEPAPAPAHAEKAKKKPFPPKDEEAEEEDAEDSEEEDMEEEEAPEEEKEFAESEDDYFPMGDIDIKEFGGLLAEAMTAAMQPVIDELITVKESFTSVKELVTSGSSSATKETTANQAAIESAQKQIASLTKQLADVTSQLKELGAPPRSLAGLGATQDASTAVKEGDPLLQSVPQQDPLNDFAKFAIGANVTPGA